MSMEKIFEIPKSQALRTKMVDSRMHKLSYALRDPKRRRIIMLLAEEGPLTVDTIIRKLGLEWKQRALIYYHLNVLERTGLIRSYYELGSRHKRYEVTERGRSILLNLTNSSEASLRARVHENIDSFYVTKVLKMALIYIIVVMTTLLLLAYETSIGNIFFRAFTVTEAFTLIALILLPVLVFIIIAMLELKKMFK